MSKKSFYKYIAKKECVSSAFIEKQINQGRVVIPLNNKKEIKNPVAIGEGLKIKINTNIGVSTEKTDINKEITKLKTAVQYGTHTVMDLSVGNNLKTAREKIMAACPVPLGTVPIYEAATEAEKKKGSFEKVTFDDIWDVLKEQADTGVDFFTIHAGILMQTIPLLKKKKRVGGIVSRGGAILTRWMYVNGKENPFYENFDKILELAKEYNITISLGDALRPGAIADSSDKLQISELHVLGKLVKKCRQKGVGVMVEGPGHVRFDEIAWNMQIEKKICYRAPFYVLGPIPIDIAAGYDHITSAIGGALAAFHGADFLCVVTPAEHLRHPIEEDIKDGVIASRIAAHSIDILRFKDEYNRDYRLSLLRAHRKWKKLFPLTIDENKSRSYREEPGVSVDVCTMCGKFCSLKMIEGCNLLK